MDRGQVYQKGKHTQHYTISKYLESCTDTFYRYLQEPKIHFYLGWSGQNSCRSRVLASCLKRWVGFWLLAIKWQNPAGGKAWTQKWRLESKGHVYLMARSLIWLEWGGHIRVTSNEGRKSGPKSKGLIYELFGRWEPQKVFEQGTGWSRAPRVKYVTTYSSQNPPLSVRDAGRKTVLFSFRRNAPSLKAGIL